MIQDLKNKVLFRANQFENSLEIGRIMLVWKVWHQMVSSQGSGYLFCLHNSV